MLPLAQGQASQKQLKWAFALRAAQSSLSNQCPFLQSQAHDFCVLFNFSGEETMTSFTICRASYALKFFFFFFRVQLFYREGSLLGIKPITPPRGSRLLFIFKYVFI